MLRVSRRMFYFSNGGQQRRAILKQIVKRNENLDISWLRDDSLRSGDNLPEPEVIAAEIMEKLRIATFLE